jgi:UDP-glucose 4-epimerase
MKVVVTGGSGQLGSLVLERLVASRKIKRIVSLDLVPPRVPSPKLDYRIADMRDPGLERHVEGADAVIHLAFVVARARSREAMRAANVDGTRRVFDAAALHGVGTVVYTSSVAAYGMVAGQPEPIVEDTPRRRTGILDYADHKYEVERMLDTFELEHPAMRVVRLRPGILLGRRVAHLPERVLHRRVMPLVGDEPAPVVWDEDVADAVLLALLGGARGAFNLVADHPLRGEELARLGGFRPLRLSAEGTARLLKLSAVFGSEAPDPAWLQAANVRLIVSSARARQELGWKPRYPTAADVATALGKQTPRQMDRRIRLFLGLAPRMARHVRSPEEMSAGDRALKLVLHLDITGPRGGDYTLALDEGALSVRRGIPRPPDAVVTVSAETFLGMLAGTVNPNTASMTGKLRVRGEPIATLVMTGLVRGFRMATEQAGVGGKVARGISRWFQRG